MLSSDQKTALKSLAVISTLAAPAGNLLVDLVTILDAQRVQGDFGAGIELVVV